MATQYPPAGDQILVKPESVPVAEPKEAPPIATSTEMNDMGEKSLPDANPGPLTASRKGDDDGAGAGPEQAIGTDVQDGDDGNYGDEALEEESLEARIERL
ncbi:hypothetical protein V490_03241, partial [Pseudogymnoascus sp. VKM F-3557]